MASGTIGRVELPSTNIFHVSTAVGRQARSVGRASVQTVTETDSLMAVLETLGSLRSSERTYGPVYTLASTPSIYLCICYVLFFYLHSPGSSARRSLIKTTGFKVSQLDSFGLFSDYIVSIGTSCCFSFVPRFRCFITIISKRYESPHLGGLFLHDMENPSSGPLLLYPIEVKVCVSQSLFLP